MNIADVFPPKGRIQTIYCDGCQQHLDLDYTTFDEIVSGVDLRIVGLPVLRCTSCSKDHLPDLSRLAIIEKHREAVERGSSTVRVTRRKSARTFAFTDVPFQYDADDYLYIPGLYREWGEGFLNPVFFNREVLLKYDTHPKYAVRFASRTYGDIDTGDSYIPFGINKHGRVVMWLGDIAKLPKPEQYYLCSENVPSDHSIGSEFYDGQIECKFTDLPPEDELFKARSLFVEYVFKQAGKKIAQLDKEVIDLTASFNAPVIDTAKERRHVADTLNKIYLESLDNGALGDLLKDLGGDPAKLGSLKRLQGVMEVWADGRFNVPAILSPLYVLYDLRVAYSHLTSADKATEILGKVTRRLGLSDTATLSEIYDGLIAELTKSFTNLREIAEAYAAKASA